MKKGIMLISLIIVLGLIGIGFVCAANNSCTKDSDCKVKFSACSCSNACILKSSEGNVDCARACTLQESNTTIKSCKCENNKCVGIEETIVGNDSDSHGCKGSAGYSWCEDKKKCLRIWEENCTNKTNKTLPGEGKVKILPETASLRARERLGELGFNVSLKEVGTGNGNETKYVYEVNGEKDVKLLGFMKTKAKISVDVDAETGDVLKVHRPWWAFMASGF